MADSPTQASDDVSAYVRQFEEAELATQTGRKEAERCRDYYDGRQFTDAEIKTLKRRKQPIVHENLIKEKVETLCGIERQSRVDPKAYPRVPSKEMDADAVTDALRYVEEDQDLGIKKSRVFEGMLVEGFGGVEIGVRQLRGGVIDPYVCLIAWDRIYADPHSREADYSDASYTGYVTWMDIDAAKLKWPDRASVIDDTAERGASARSDTYDDKPKWSYWYDAKRRRIRVNTHCHMENGVWNRCVFTLAGELEASAPSPFIDDEGNPENPLLLQSAYVDRDNDRYGIVRDMIPLQDEVNKRRSKFLHMVNSNKIRVSPALGVDQEAVRKEYARPDAVIVAENGDVEELGNEAKETGQFTLLQDTRATLKGNIGPNAYLNASAGEGQSGRAVLAQQQAGMTQMTPLLDNLRHFTIRLYRQIWNRIRQYWNAERWIRVTDDESNVRFVGLNTPPQMDPARAQMAMMKIQAAVQSQQLDPQTAQQYAQQIQQMSTVGNHLAELDVDIDIDEVNETPTLQIEQFQQLTQLVGTGVLGAPPPPEIIEMIIQASSLRDKQKLIDVIEKMKAAASQPNPMQDIAVQDATAKVDETKSKTILNLAKAHRDASQPEVEGLKAGVSAGIRPPLPVQPSIQGFPAGVQSLSPAAGVPGAPG